MWKDGKIYFLIPLERYNYVVSADTVPNIKKNLEKLSLISEGNKMIDSFNLSKKAM